MILDPRSDKIRNAYSVNFNEKERGLETEEKKNELPIQEVTLRSINGINTVTNTETVGSTVINTDTDDNTAINTETYDNADGRINAVRCKSSYDATPKTFLKNWIYGKYDEKEPREESKTDDDVDMLTKENARELVNNEVIPITSTNKPFVDWAEEKSTPVNNEMLWNENNLNLTDESEGNALIGVCMALTLNNESAPKSWKQAINIHEWEMAMVSEIKELQNKKAWEVVPKPTDKKVLPGVWNFRVKKDERGNLVKYKARWCVDGSREGFSRPPENVFSPVAELPTVRSLLVIAAQQDQVVLQADFPNAYVNADIKEDVYVCQPKGLEEKDSDKYVCKLRKALYGCPISGKRWNETLTEAILSLGYKKSVIDHCLFSRDDNENKDLMVIYVDDILVTSNGGEKRADNLLNELGEVFEIKKLGTARHILGLGIHQGSDGIFLEQEAYVESILVEQGYESARTRGTPWDSHIKDDCEALPQEQILTFRRTLGQLAYLANGTRPDIMWAVARLATGITTPTKGLWNRIGRLLRYLNGTKDRGLFYERKDKTPKLETFVDSSFAVDERRGRSVTGYITYLNGGPVMWKSHLQSTVADSPNAAEYIALYESAVASTGLSNLLSEIGVELEDTCCIFEDNDGSRRLAMSGMGQKKARHLQTKHHYVQELCSKGKIKVLRVPTGDQPADLLTKGSHTGKVHSHLLKKLGVVNHTHNA